MQSFGLQALTLNLNRHKNTTVPASSLISIDATTTEKAAAAKKVVAPKPGEKVRVTPSPAPSPSPIATATPYVYQNPLMETFATPQAYIDRIANLGFPLWFPVYLGILIAFTGQTFG